MRVLWLSHLVPWPATGQGSLQRSHHLLLEAARRFEVHLIAVNNRGLLSDDQIPTARRALTAICASVEVVARPADRSRVHRAWAVAASLVRREPYEVSWLRAPHLDALLAERGLTEHFDLIHVDTIGLAPHTCSLGALPLVLGHENVESTMAARRAERETNFARRLYLRREARLIAQVERRFAARAQCNLVVSELDSERLSAVVPGAVTRVVANGVDTEYFAPTRTLGHGEGGLVFAGGMDWYPNRAAARWFATELWPALLHDRPERRAVWIGREPPPELVAAARDARLIVPGFVDDVRPWIDAASIYLCPINDGGGTRLKILDALAMAKPLVATDVAVEGLGLVEERHYLRAENVSELVRQVGRLEGDASLRRRLAEAGRRLVEERFAWRVIGRALESAWFEAIDAARRDPVRASETRPRKQTRPHVDRCGEADAADTPASRAPVRS
jgi:glycosyltransferase involved in cell wall biosynthesis